MIVKKALGMAKLMNVPVLGLVENMSYVKCPCCGQEIHMFGQGRIDQIAASEGIPVIAKLPIDASFTAACDSGQVEYVDAVMLDGLADVLPDLD